MGSHFGTQIVKILHAASDSVDDVLQVEAHIQAAKGFFNIDTPIFEGDLVEVADPRAGLTALNVGLRRR